MEVNFYIREEVFSLVFHLICIFKEILETIGGQRQYLLYFYHCVMADFYHFMYIRYFIFS